MNKLLIQSALILTLGANLPAANALSTEHKRELSFGGSAVVGALLGGPVGYVIGAAGGAYLAEQIKNVEEAEMALAQRDIEQELLSQNYEIANSELELAQAAIQEYESALALAAQTPLFFSTGSDQLTKQELTKLGTTIEYLNENPEVTVELKGYADPRGTEGYNIVLSEYRALAVKQALMLSGIDEARIVSQGLGIKSPANSDNTAVYAMERRVDINFTDSENSSFAMQ